MDLHITFDISDKLNAALGRLAIAIEAVKVCTPLPAHSEAVECPAKSAEIAPAAQLESKQATTQSKPENAPEAKSERPAEVKPEAAEAAAQNDNGEPGLDKAFKSWVVAVASEQPEKKPAKKKAVKKAEIAPVTQVAPDRAITQPEPKAAKTEPVLAQSEPESAKVEEPAKTTDDGMAGMNLMEAAKQLIEDIQDAGIEMADANARVRAKANELGLNFGSITCLIKAIGYVEAKKVAVGK